MNVPRNEYPRPQFARSDWLCLNGTWQFEVDAGDSGIERGLKDRELAGSIVVPFCPESKLSGVENHDFMNAVWYRRTVTIPPEWKGQRVLLHFGAVDYDATVWVNGQEAGRHRGGWCRFTCELHGLAAPGDEVVIVVRARDDMRIPKPNGKQATKYHPHGCDYLRTTGIWQTVWMEPVPPTRIERPRVTPDLANSCFRLVVPIVGPRTDLRLRATLLADGQQVVATETMLDQDFSGQCDLVIPRETRRLWSPADPFLYDLQLELINDDAQVVDMVSMYAGLRSVAIHGKAVLINGEPVFQRLVLDQGFYPEGILTAPDDEALIQDIRLSMEAGFNGARLHQKVFEERFLYHADRLGYLCWGEFGDWGIDKHNTHATIITQWLEALARDYSHPCIIGWCGLNESWISRSDRIDGLDDLTLGVFLAAKAMDPTRPVLDASGGAHRVLVTDIWDSHDYEQDATQFGKNHAVEANQKPFTNQSEPADRPWNTVYRNQPYFVSEFGGALWNPHAKPDDEAWGYGSRPKTMEQFLERFEQLCGVLLDDPHMFGYCYTQLTDVFQEQNGLFFFDRSPKFDLSRLRGIQSRPAAIETISDTGASGIPQDALVGRGNLL
ncbi:MAG: beta-galactosidase [Burkholderiales bacterium]|nr:beta-galactosidase [Phycisphaerae bacterium]